MAQTTMNRPIRPKARAGLGHPWLTLVAVSLGVMMVGLDATVVSIAAGSGGRSPFVVGIVAFAIASVAVGLAPSLGWVIAFRVLQGFAGALLQPASLAILRNTFPPEKLNAAIGIWGATVGISIAGGPIVGGLLVENVNWQSVFFLNAPLGLIALGMSIWVIRESKDTEAGGKI